LFEERRTVFTWRIALDVHSVPRGKRASKRKRLFARWKKGVKTIGTRVVSLLNSRAGLAHTGLGGGGGVGGVGGSFLRIQFRGGRRKESWTESSGKTEKRYSLRLGKVERQSKKINNQIHMLKKKAIE